MPTAGGELRLGLTVRDAKAPKNESHRRAYQRLKERQGTASWKMIEPSMPVAYPGRLFTASYVLSISYLAPLHDTAMNC